MNKYTILEGFEKTFPFTIWKIQIDSVHENIAVEYRDPNTTLATISVFNFNGDTILEQYKLEEKEWTLETIFSDFLILKKYGSNAPIQPGICIVHIPSQKIIATHAEYILDQVYQNYILAHHRTIPQGMPFFIELQSGLVSSKKDQDLIDIPTEVNYPDIYNGRLPHFLDTINYVDKIWFQPHKNIFIWCYHKKDGNSYKLLLSLSTNNQLLETKNILTKLDKLIPQPYFQVKDQIFFLSSNKKKITTYLV